MALYRMKPITVEAVQWTGTNATAVLDFTEYEARIAGDVIVLSGKAVEINEWILKAPTGDLEFCSATEFAATYDPES